MLYMYMYSVSHSVSQTSIQPILQLGCFYLNEPDRDSTVIYLYLDLFVKPLIFNCEIYKFEEIKPVMKVGTCPVSLTH